MASQLPLSRPCRINELSSGFVGSHQTLTTHCGPIENFTLYRKVVVIHRRCAERSYNRGGRRLRQSITVYDVYKTAASRLESQAPFEPVVDGHCRQGIGTLGIPTRVTLRSLACEIESDVDVVLAAKPRRIFLSNLHKVIPDACAKHFRVDATHLADSEILRLKIFLGFKPGHSGLQRVRIFTQNGLVVGFSSSLCSFLQSVPYSNTPDDEEDDQRYGQSPTFHVSLAEHGRQHNTQNDPTDNSCHLTPTSAVLYRMTKFVCLRAYAVESRSLRSIQRSRSPRSTT
jgi:hypothetical protein